jgi:hypothetical protein
VTSLNGLHGAVTLAGGSNVTLTPSGTTITIAATGGSGGGLTLPYAASATLNQGTSQSLFQIANTGNSPAIVGQSGGATTLQGGYPPAVWGRSATEVGVLGSSDAQVGVQGVSSDGAGVRGDSLNYIGLYGEGSSGGVYGTSESSAGVKGISMSSSGVSGNSTNGDGVYALGRTGVEGHSSDASGTGVYGASASGDGVRGESSSGNGVHGKSSYNGVYGEGLGASAAGVSGVNDNGHIGVYGRAAASSFKAGYFDGGITIINGSKAFVEPHPTDPTKEIRYVCLEGPESGTYFRGTGHIVNGFATIAIPEHFRMVTAETGLTVVVTPEGEMAVLACVKKSLEKIVIQGSKDVEFDYMVNGVRTSVPRLAPIEENRFFVPTSPHDPALTRPLGEETRARLVRSGILNPDGTINLETAHRLGWDQTEKWKQAEGAKKDEIN